MEQLLTLLAIVTIAGLILSCGGNDEKKKNDGAIKKAEAPERQGYDNDDPALYGDVESITIKQYYTEDKFGEVVKGEMYESRTYRFNQRGDVIEGAKYSDGSLGEKYLFKYDSAGNMIEGALYNSDGSLDEKHLFKYDPAGNKIEEADYRSDGRQNWKHLYKYDSAGNMIEGPNLYGGKSSYKYDSAGNIIEKTDYKGEIMEPQSITECEIVYRE